MKSGGQSGGWRGEEGEERKWERGGGREERGRERRGRGERREREDTLVAIEYILIYTVTVVDNVLYCTYT